MLVVIIIGGIYSGIFTATEAAAMGAVYAFFISVFVYWQWPRQRPRQGPRPPVPRPASSLPWRL
jgi:TRAP-type C4-dicarboxylate transport system permease large subunit